MKYVYCSVNGWDCPYYLESKSFPSDDSPEKYCRLCKMNNPAECDDFLCEQED